MVFLKLHIQGPTKDCFFTQSIQSFLTILSFANKSVGDAAFLKMLHYYLWDFLSNQTPISPFLLPSTVLFGMKQHDNAHTHLSDDKMKSLDQVCACVGNNYIMTAAWTTVIIGRHQFKIYFDFGDVKM